MKDRFCDTAKLIFDDRDFLDVENAIAQLHANLGFKPERSRTTGTVQRGIESVLVDFDKRGHHHAQDKPPLPPPYRRNVHQSSSGFVHGATPISRRPSQEKVI